MLIFMRLEIALLKPRRAGIKPAARREIFYTSYTPIPQRESFCLWCSPPTPIYFRRHGGGGVRVFYDSGGGWAHQETLLAYLRVSLKFLPTRLALSGCLGVPPRGNRAKVVSMRSPISRRAHEVKFGVSSAMGPAFIRL